ncbi:hypothetical protein GGF37_004854, partial [Kickxella alabastrina]
NSERTLNHPDPSTLDCKLYVEYLLECRKGDFILGEYYHNAQTLGKSRKYDGSSSNDPLHCKLRYLFFVNRKRADVELAKSLRAKFGPDPVLILGNWIPSMTCHRESIRGKGLQEMLIGQGSTVYLIDEYCTSAFCPACEGSMEKLHKIDDPRLQNPKHRSHV